MTNTAAPAHSDYAATFTYATREDRQLRDVIRTFEMIAGSEFARRGLKFDGYVSVDQIANYVDIAPADILALATTAEEAMTSPTHKVSVWGNRITADRVS
ncbi:hypothetical protein CH253_07980 [Rhodococcus sp. 06-156-3C]|uniref:hypothetical protein n=1 Tax=Rhodococcus sp. 06-156-3C TaxID=2022486 RepID=UPI000B9B7F38|nr:hypothetical protein [Rhodococcus sp. 06-156-3C]OZD23791.1 hypothetical protein CH253_07980 [Rhodococcus sp. 06-156-3C]